MNVNVWPDNEAAEIDGDHVEPVNAVQLEDGLLRHHHAHQDEDQRVGQVRQRLPEPEYS